ARRRGVDRDGLLAPVEHDKIVAQSVHLAERNLRHAAAYMAGRPAMSNAGGPASLTGAATPPVADRPSLCHRWFGLGGTRFGTRELARHPLAGLHSGDSQLAARSRRSRLL